MPSAADRTPALQSTHATDALILGAQDEVHGNRVPLSEGRQPCGPLGEIGTEQGISIRAAHLAHGFGRVAFCRWRELPRCARFQEATQKKHASVVDLACRD